MREIDTNFTKDFSSYTQVEGQSPMRGMSDWAVPWADLMMVMFVLFVVLFIYASTHQDVKILFSRQSADKAQATSTLDPLVGLIGQLSSRADTHGSQDFVRVAENQVLYRSRANGVTVIREGHERIRVTLRGELFFSSGNGELQEDSSQYLKEIAEIVRLSVGTVHVIGYASEDEAPGPESFAISTDRAAEVAEQLIAQFGIDPKRVILTGRGAYVPELPETSSENQMRNRRVEIVITNEN